MASGMRLRSSGATRVLPERLRHDAEHGAAVEPLEPALERVAAEAPDLKRLRERHDALRRLLRQRVRPGLGRHGQPLPRGRARLRRSAMRAQVLERAGALLPRQPSSRASRSAVTSASPAARCRAGFSKPKCCVRLSSPQERHALHQPARQPHGAELGAVERQVARPPHSALTKPQSNRALWATNTRPASAASDLVRHLGEGRRVPDHLVGDVGDGADRRRDRAPRVDQRLERPPRAGRRAPPPRRSR